MQRFLSLIVLVLLLNACKKEIIRKDPVKVIPGGIGGTYNIALFPLSGKAGVSGKCYIRYACDAIPAGSTTYNDSSATMVEPGFGPHVHFNGLKEGFYLLSAKGIYNSKEIKGDTIIEIVANQTVPKDYNLQLK